jgi:AAA family ATP:ADP antiporter
VKSRHLDKALRVFGDVHAGEGTRLLLLACDLFLLLFAYYLLKTVREPLVLGTGGAEVKSYAAACEAILLVGVALAFGWLATHVRRLALLTSVTGFFAANLLLFAILLLALPRHQLALGVAFFIWVGCFNVMIIAQFWAFANDLHTKDQGERLFGVIAGGSAIGAVVGAKLAKPLFAAIGPCGIMLVAAAMLVVTMGLTWIVNQGEHPKPREARHDAAEGTGDKLRAGNGLSLMVRDPYLLFVGALSLLKNFINTTGEYILDRRLIEGVARKVDSSLASREAFIAAFKSDYFTWVNGVVLVLQFFAVSRVVKYVGVRRALFFLPVIAFCSYGAMALVPVLTVILIGKIAENATDYSFQKTTEQMLFLVTSREAKYKVKAIADTVLVRLGDVFSAATVWVGVHLGLSTTAFIGVNLALIGCYTLLVMALVRAHDRKEATLHHRPARARSRAVLRTAHAAATS